MKRLIAITVALGVMIAAAVVVGMATPTAKAADVPATWYTVPFCVGGETWWLTDEEAIPPPPADELTAQTLSAWIEEDGIVYVLVDGDTTWVRDTPKEGFTAVTAAAGECPVAPTPGPAASPPPEPARIAYCSVAGNTLPNGTPLVPGTFLNLLAGQPGADAHYTGATPAFWVEGVGLTCSLTPAQAALASASTVKVGGGGTPLAPEFGGFYTFIPSK